MGKGGYTGGSTILRIPVPKSLKSKKKSAPSDYDFEERAEDIRREMKKRKEKLAKGQSLIDFEKSNKAKRKAVKVKKPHGLKKNKKV